MNLLGALAKVGSLTMVSRVLGFVRDFIIARTFGAGVATDAFFVAFKLPNLLRRIFAEGAFSQAFVPVLAEYKRNKSPEAAREFTQYVAGLLTFALTVVTALGILAAPAVIWISAPGFTGDAGKFALSVQLLQIVFPYIFLISLSSFVGSILNTYHKFAVPAFTPVFLNISFIVFALFFVPYFDPPVLALAWAVFVGGVLQLGFQLPWLFKLGFLKMPKLDFRRPEALRVAKQMGPALIGVSVAQISLVINTIFASFLQTGSVTWMYYADRLMELPSGVLGVALGTILLPTLSKHASGNNPAEFSALLDWGLRLTLMLALPAAVGLAVLSMPLLSTLFMSEKFTLHDVLMTRQALIAYSVSLVGMILVKILAPGFYSHQNVKTPMKIAVFTLVCTQLMNLLFIGPLKHAGLSLAVGLGACVNAGLLYVLLRLKGLYTPKAGWRNFLIKLFIALAVMAGSLAALDDFAGFEWIQASGRLKAVQLAALIAAGIAAYFGSLAALGFRPRHFRRTEH